MVPICRDTGNGEMVRQERTAVPVTVLAGQTPPPARPNSWLGSHSAIYCKMGPVAWPEHEQLVLQITAKQQLDQ